MLSDWLIYKKGKYLTVRGINPICLFQSTYLFGAFSPINGASFLLELAFCNTDSFQLFLDELSTQKPSELKGIFYIIVFSKELNDL
jgi:hypothetical protein